METWIIFVVWLHINYTVNAVEIFSTIFAPNDAKFMNLILTVSFN